MENNKLRNKQNNNKDSITINGIELPLINKKEFNNLYKDNCSIAGIITPFTKNKKRKSAIEKNGKRIIILKEDQKPGLFTSLKGYVKTKENEYIKVYTKNYLLLFILLSILVLLLILTLLLRPDRNSNNNKPLELEESQQDYVANEKQVDHSKNIVMPGWAEFNIEANTIDITKGIDMYNPSSNRWYKCPKCEAQLDDNLYCEECEKQYKNNEVKEDLYYMTFALVLEENDEVIYQSKLVEPDKHLQHITLTRPLEKGTYDAYVLIKPYKSDMATECNNGKVMITLNVK